MTADDPENSDTPFLLKVRIEAIQLSPLLLPDQKQETSSCTIPEENKLLMEKEKLLQAKALLNLLDPSSVEEFYEQALQICKNFNLPETLLPENIIHIQNAPSEYLASLPSYYRNKYLGYDATLNKTIYYPINDNLDYFSNLFKKVKKRISNYIDACLSQVKNGSCTRPKINRPSDILHKIEALRETYEQTGDEDHFCYTLHHILHKEFLSNMPTLKLEFHTGNELLQQNHNNQNIWPDSCYVLNVPDQDTDTPVLMGCCEYYSRIVENTYNGIYNCLSNLSGACTKGYISQHINPNLDYKSCLETLKEIKSAFEKNGKADLYYLRLEQLVKGSVLLNGLLDPSVTTAEWILNEYPDANIKGWDDKYFVEENGKWIHFEDCSRRDQILNDTYNRIETYLEIRYMNDDDS